MRWFLLLSLVACSTSRTRLSQEGKEVRVLSSQKNNGCVVMDKVVGENDLGSLELAKNHARNLVAEKGGRGIFFEDHVRNGKSVRVYATAYECL